MMRGVCVEVEDGMVCLASQTRGSPLFMLFEEVPLSSSRDALIKQFDNERGSR